MPSSRSRLDIAPVDLGRRPHLRPFPRALALHKRRGEVALPHIISEEEGHATLAMSNICDGLDGDVSRTMGGRLRLASMSDTSTSEDHTDSPQEGRDGGCAWQSRDAAPVDNSPGADVA